jgi:restriction endonuclease
MSGHVKRLTFTLDSYQQPALKWYQSSCCQKPAEQTVFDEAEMMIQNCVRHSRTFSISGVQNLNNNLRKKMEECELALKNEKNVVRFTQMDRRMQSIQLKSLTIESAIENRISAEEKIRKKRTITMITLPGEIDGEY